MGNNIKKKKICFSQLKSEKEGILNIENLKNVKLDRADFLNSYIQLFQFSI